MGAFLVLVLGFMLLFMAMVIPFQCYGVKKAAEIRKETEKTEQLKYQWKIDSLKNLEK